MNRTFALLLALLSAVFATAQKPITAPKEHFTPEALSQMVFTKEGETIGMSDVLAQYKGSVLIIDFWASWCKDCIKALPESKRLFAKYPKAKVLYLSLDRTHQQWLAGMKKYKLGQTAHYRFPEWKNVFNQYIELNWVPRLMVLDAQGNIAHYYSIQPNDPSLVQVLDKIAK